MRGTRRRRTDPSDGEDYDRNEFVEHYGGTAQWKAAPRALGVGGRVIVTGLKARPDLNGRSGVVLGEAVTSTALAKRWEVRVDGEERHKSLRPANLINADDSTTGETDDALSSSDSNGAPSAANRDVVWTDDSGDADSSMFDTPSLAEREADNARDKQGRTAAAAVAAAREREAEQIRRSKHDARVAAQTKRRDVEAQRQRERESVAARRVQALQRGKTARRGAARATKRNAGAATRLQSAHRGRQARRRSAQQRALAVREEQTSAARALQSAQRGRAARRGMAPTHLALELAALDLVKPLDAPSERDAYVELVRLAGVEHTAWRSEVRVDCASPEWQRAIVPLRSAAPPGRSSTRGSRALGARRPAHAPSLEEFASSRYALRVWDWDSADAAELVGESQPFTLRELSVAAKAAARGEEPHRIALTLAGSSRRERQRVGSIIVHEWTPERREASGADGGAANGSTAFNGVGGAVGLHGTVVPATLAPARPAGFDAAGGAHTMGRVAVGERRVRLRLDASLTSRRAVFVALRRLRRKDAAHAASTARSGWTVYRSATSADGAALRSVVHFLDPFLFSSHSDPSSLLLSFLRISWARVEISLAALCGGDVDWPLELRICCADDAAAGRGGSGAERHATLARVVTSLSELMATEGSSVALAAEPTRAGRASAHGASVTIAECALLAPDLWEGTLRSLHAAHAAGVVQLRTLTAERDDVRAKREEAVAHAQRVEVLLSEKHAAHEEVAERVAAVEDANAELALRCEELEATRRYRVGFSSPRAAGADAADPVAAPASPWDRDRGHAAALRGYATAGDVEERVRRARRKRAKESALRGARGQPQREQRPATAPFASRARGRGSLSLGAFAEGGPIDGRRPSSSARSAGVSAGGGGASRALGATATRRQKARRSRGRRALFREKRFESSKRAGAREFAKASGGAASRQSRGVGMLLSVATGTACRSPRTEDEQQRAWQIILQNAKARDLEAFAHRFPRVADPSGGGGGNGGGLLGSLAGSSGRGGVKSPRSPHALAPMGDARAAAAAAADFRLFDARAVEAQRTSDRSSSWIGPHALAPGAVATSVREGARDAGGFGFAPTSSSSSRATLSPTASARGGASKSSNALGVGVAPFSGEMALLSKIRALERKARERESELVSEIAAMKAAQNARAEKGSAAAAAQEAAEAAALAAAALKARHDELASQLQSERVAAQHIAAKCERFQRAAEGTARARSKRRTMENKANMLQKELDGVREAAAAERAVEAKRHAAALHTLSRKRKGEAQVRPRSCVSSHPQNSATPSLFSLVRSPLPSPPPPLCSAFAT